MTGNSDDLRVVLRDTHPTAEALYAMALFHNEYAAQNDCCMDFFDKLTLARRKQCERDVSRIKSARRWRRQ